MDFPPTVLALPESLLEVQTHGPPCQTFRIKIYPLSAPRYAGTVSLRSTTPEVPRGTEEELGLGVGQTIVLFGNVCVIMERF